jgi:site-specific DNA recombinase
MSKRAGIYIRVSSESQAEKVSPQAQEQDCINYCGSHDYQVVEVYRDTAKYRVGRKLVEPTATRADRPQFKRMLSDARAGLFDVIVAWREDRLYRAYRPLADVSECMDETGIEIELARDTFDKKMMGIKASVAKMELDAKHERLMMGVGGRLANGKDWNSSPPYGYFREDGIYRVNETEAEWVQKIWTWFGNGDTAKAIRMRLIEACVPQRSWVKFPWTIARIYQLIKRDFYHSGIITRKWGNDVNTGEPVIYELQLPALIDDQTYQKVKNRLADWKKYPIGNLKEKALAAGLVYCAADGTRMIVKHTPSSIYYACSRQFTLAERPPKCAGCRSIRKLDAEVWAKLWGLISDPAEFERKLQERINTLQNEEVDANAECDKLASQLGELAIQRQWVITQARKEIITDYDMKLQLMTLTDEEHETAIKMDEYRLLSGDRAGQLTNLISLYSDRARLGYDNINAMQPGPEMEELQFQFKKKLVQGIVKRVDVFRDHSIKVYTEFDLSENINEPSTH